MGNDYDPALAHMCRQVRMISDAKTTLTLPSAISVDVQPQAVMRSVLGHLSAQGVDRYEKGQITEPVRDYILDGSLSLPTSLRIYYWLYPYRQQILIRDAVRLTVSNSVIVAFWLMKFFPLAFLVTQEETAARQFSLRDLDSFGRRDFTARESVLIDLKPLVHPYWPEHPTTDAAILYGPAAMTADPLSRIARI